MENYRIKGRCQPRCTELNFVIALFWAASKGKPFKTALRLLTNYRVWKSYVVDYDNSDFITDVNFWRPIFYLTIVIFYHAVGIYNFSKHSTSRNSSHQLQTLGNQIYGSVNPDSL